ncbi:hypothetical protein SAMN05444673_3395 [Bacillus sp. OV166]|uniref:phage lytic cycle repressor MrpR family protein n=1 Tax=Bacillus sp. OV166 TaxID=1882763 RepID=UPI000A2AE1AD|nr:hypothetical protein [Bacillus sp. OV166]SMQ78375.1 hypothetical protein SAMN05444673_3395 [Bacillus sp. OV166]
METINGDVYVINNKINHKVLIGEGDDGSSRLSQHRSNLKKGIERNKPLQEDYEKYGEDVFEYEVIINSIDRKLCEQLLIELFSRVDKAYNKRDRSGGKIRKIEQGELLVPAILYQEIEAFIHQWEQKLPYFKDLLDELEDMKAGFESKSEKIFNRDFKKSFLTGYEHETQRVAKQLFKITYDFEVELNKDLYNFTFEEAGKVLSALGAGTIRSIQNSKPTLSKYLEFAIQQVVSDNKINYYKNLRKKEDISMYLNKDKEENTIFDKEEIMEMAMDSDNAQDGVILALLFDGISHKNEFEELRNLTLDNINEDNQQIILSDRTIPMSTETSVLVKKAIKDDTYVSIKGETSRKYKIAQGTNLLRGLRGKVQVKGQIVSQRILRIAEIFDYEYLNATTISYSGQIHYAIDLINNGINIDESTSIIINRFGINDNPASRFYLKTRIENFIKRKNDQDNRDNMDDE